MCTGSRGADLSEGAPLAGYLMGCVSTFRDPDPCDHEPQEQGQVARTADSENRKAGHF